VTAVQPQIQLRVRRGERPARLTRPGRQELQLLQQLLVTIRYRRAVCDHPTDVHQGHQVMAADLDVLDRLVVNQRLQPCQPEQRVEHRTGQLVLL
jgi:hypothetical protein